ncbi:MAG TPA: hypothetical protein VF950_13445 [Planctomycetota bacterium]
MSVPIRPLTILAIGPVALGVAMALVVPFIETPFGMSWKAAAAGGGVGLAVGLVLFLGIAWAELPRPVPRLPRGLLAASWFFCLGYVASGRPSALCMAWLFIGAFLNCLLAWREGSVNVRIGLER